MRLMLRGIKGFCSNLLLILCLGPALAAAAEADPALLTGQTGSDPKGAAIYAQHCADCHDHPRDRILPRSSIAIYRTPEEVVRALKTGLMQQQGNALSEAEKRQVAAWVTGKKFGQIVDINPKANMCRMGPRQSKPSLKSNDAQWNGWGNGLGNARFQSEPGFAAADVPRLKLKWAFAYPGHGAFGQATVLGDYVYVTSLVGWVFALDAETGCTYWSLDAGAQVRSGVVVGTLPPSAATSKPMARDVAFFTNELGKVFAVDARTGAPVWTVRIEDHPMARTPVTPVLHNGRLYITLSSIEEVTAADPKYACCGARGGLVALDARDGRIVWKSYAINKLPKPTKISSAGVQLTGPAGAAIFNAPAVDVRRDLLYAGTGDNYTDVVADSTNSIIAVDSQTGERRWVFQAIKHDAWILGCSGESVANCPSPLGPDHDFGAAPMLLPLAKDASGRDRQILIAASKSGDVFGLDPDQNGKVLWQTKIARGGSQGGILWGGAAEGEKVFLAISDFDFKRPKDAGGMVALDIATGKELWRTATPTSQCKIESLYCSPAQPAAVTGMPGAVFSGALDGRIRAYAGGDGKILWTFDTTQTFAGVNGAKVTGGSIDNGGQTIANGKLFVNSGSTRMNGNALLVFSVDGK